MSRLALLVAAATLTGCSSNHVSPFIPLESDSAFIGRWSARDANFNDGASHDLELNLKPDGSFHGVNATRDETYTGDGIWKQTSKADAILFGPPGEGGSPSLLHLHGDGLIVTSRNASETLHRAQS